MRRLLSIVAVLCLLCAAAQAGVDELEIDASAVSLNLNSIPKIYEREIESLAEKLNAVETLETCDLSAVTLSMKAKEDLVKLCPQIEFRFTLPVYNREIDSLSETFDIDSLKCATKIKLADYKQILRLMPRVKRVVMYNAQFSIATMENLTAEFPDVSFEWTLRFDGIEVKNTATAFSTLKGRQEPRYTAKQLEPLVKYCPDLLALDVGHNNVHDLSFLSAWPDLRWLIVIDSEIPVTDISPLAKLMDLEYVELFMQNITDISPLAGHTKLLDLNLCHNDITDLSPLYSCVNLERLYISVNPHLTQEELAELQAVLPGLRIETSDWQSTGAGWREHPRYFIMYEGFTTGEYIPFDQEE
ncbi:MAG: hypothetical protein JW811_01755 [Clostridiales bacterium]|nr:hypothetical protein [Clostridiales bacterium]